MPTAIWSWQMKSRSAHCDLELADAVRQFPLRSAAGDTEARGVRGGGGGEGGGPPHASL